MKPISRHALFAGFAVALAVLGLVARLNGRNSARLQETMEWVAHTHRVQAELNRLLALLEGVETGSRGFVVTGDPAYLEPYESARGKVPSHVQTLRGLTRDNARQQAACNALEPLTVQRVAQAQATVAARKNSGFEAARQEMALGKGKALMDQIRGLIIQMDLEEARLLDERSDAAQRGARNAHQMTIAGTSLSFVLLVMVFALVLRENRLRQRAQAELDRFFTLSLDMLCIASADGYFKRISPAFTRTLGWSVKEILARPYTELVHPDDVAATQREVERQVKAGETVFQFENRYRHKDGSWRVLSWKSVPQPGGLMYAVARDVTELKRAEQALRESELRYRTLFESIDEGFCIIEVLFDAQEKPVDYRFLEINPSFTKQTGMHDALGKTMRELAPQHESHWFEIYGGIALTGQPARFQNWAEQLRRCFDVFAFQFGAPKNRQVAILFRDITERMETEAALEASEENLDVTLQSIGDGVLATDATGRITRLNAVAEQLTGWPQDEARGRRVDEVFRIINETTRQPAVIPVDAVLATGEIHGLANHTILIARDGRERPIADSAAPIRDRAGGVRGVVLVFRDVTHEKEVELELRRTNDELEQRVQARTADLTAAENKFRTLVEQSLVGIYIIQAGRFVYVNPRMCGMLGYTPEELGARPVTDYIMEADRALAVEKIRGRLAGDIRQVRYQLRLLHKNGALVYVEPHGIRSEFQGAPAVIGNLLDVTERVHAEEEIVRKQALLRTLIDHLPGYIFVKDTAGRYLVSNEAHTALLGLVAEADLTGKTVFDIFPPELARKFDADDQELLRGGRPIFEREERFESNGKSGWHLTTKVLSRDAQGNIVNIVGIRQDITGRKEAEDEIRRLNATLEQRVKERTVQLEGANKELEAFSYSVSHDLRAPLRHIQGYVEMLQRAMEGQLSDKAQRYLKTIKSSSVEMGQLIDDLLDFSRMGRVELRETGNDLDRVVPGVIQGLAMATKDRNITWKIAPLPQVMSDPAMLRQVLANLIGNAVKYSQGRNPAAIEIGSAGEEDGRVILFVKDNGAGFEMQYAHKLFGVFQRLHRAEEFEGTGIGLATVRRIIVRHGGRTWAEGKPGEGATFYFTLKAAG